ncbi:hypothetical protein L195_g039894, partial [Trifolium pratense]
MAGEPEAENPPKTGQNDPDEAENPTGQNDPDEVENPELEAENATLNEDMRVIFEHMNGASALGGLESAVKQNLIDCVKDNFRVIGEVYLTNNPKVIPDTID